MGKAAQLLTPAHLRLTSECGGSCWHGLCMHSAGWGENLGLKAPTLPLAVSLSFPISQVQRKPLPALWLIELLCLIPIRISRGELDSFERVYQASQLVVRPVKEPNEPGREAGGGGRGTSTGAGMAGGRAPGGRRSELRGKGVVSRKDPRTRAALGPCAGLGSRLPGSSTEGPPAPHTAREAAAGAPTGTAVERPRV